MSQRAWLAEQAAAPQQDDELVGTAADAPAAKPAPQSDADWLTEQAAKTPDTELAEAKLKASANLWSDRTVEEMLEAQKLSRDLDIPTLLALENGNLLAEQAAINAANETSPVLKKYLTNPELQPILQPHIDELNTFERSLEEARQRNISGKAQRQQSTLGWQKLMTDLGVAGFEFSDREQGNLDRARASLGKGTIDYGTGWFGDMPGGWVEEYHTSGPSYLAGTATGSAGAGVGAGIGGAAGGPGGAVAGAGIGFWRGFNTGQGVHSGTQYAGSTYDTILQMKDENGNPIPQNTAAGAALAVGAANGVLEMVGLGAMVKKFPGLNKLAEIADGETLTRLLQTPQGRNALGNLAEWFTRTATGVGIEAATEALEAINEEIAYLTVEKIHGVDPDAPERDVMDSITESAYRSTLSSAPMSGVAQAVHTARSARQAAQAADRVEILREALAQAEQSRLREQSPEIFNELIEDMTEAGEAPPVLYVDQEPLMQLFQENDYNLEDVAQVSPILAAELQHAQQTGAPVAIRTEDYLAFVAVLPGGDGLLQNTRMGPNEPTQREAQAELTRATDELRTLLQEDGVEVDSTFTEDIALQLEEIGMPEQTVAPQAELLSAMVTQMAERQGVEPQQLWTDLNIQLERDGIESALETVEQELGQQEVDRARLEQREVNREEWRGRVQQSIQDDRSGLSGAIDSEGRVALVHYAHQSIQRTDPSQWGQGLSRNVRTEGARIKGGIAPGRTFFGLEHAETHPYKKESGLGNVRLEARIPAELIYPLKTEHGKVDPDGLWDQKDPDFSERDIYRAGYAGYMVDHPQLGKVVALFDEATLVETPERELLQEEQVTKHGLAPMLREEATKFTITRDKPVVMQTTNNKNAQNQLDSLDEIHKAHKHAGASVANWHAMMADALATSDIPMAPRAFLRDINGKGAFKLLSTLTEGQVADATHGFDNAAEMRQLYLDGNVTVAQTGKLFMWSFLSRGVSPYVQESLFIDAFPGIGPWIQQAADGKLDLDAYRKWSSTVAKKGSGQPGAGASHNLNAFGRNFLARMSEEYTPGVTRMQALHNAMGDPNMTGRDVRRLFASMSESVGIDNKVVSFTLLVAGYQDVLVLDRVQMRLMWDDGRYEGQNLYDGDGSTGSSLAPLTQGVRGLLLYEALENRLQQRIRKLYTDLGRPADGYIGRYHWETWVASSQQEASHATIDAILSDIKVDPQPTKGVRAKEGEYGSYAYGAQYGRNGKPYFMYAVPNVGNFKFDIAPFREFLGEVKKPGQGVVPGKFKVTESGNRPWFEQKGVNKQRLGELAQEFGEPVRPYTDPDVGDPYVPDRPAADQPGAARWQSGVSITQEGPPADPAVVKSAKALSKTINADPHVTDAKVADSVGLYAGDQERSYDMEWIAGKRFKPAAVVADVAAVAQKNNQYDAFVSRVLPLDEDNPNARPGLEFRFTDRQKLDAALPILESIVGHGADGFTMVVDPWTGDYVGARLQWAPELGMRWDKDLAAELMTPMGLEQERERQQRLMGDVAGMLQDMDGIADILVADYDTLVMGKENYGDYTTADKRPDGAAWFGQSLGENVAEAANRLGYEQPMDVGKPEQTLEQRETVKRGATRVYADRLTVAFTGDANLSTLAHESGHLYIEMLRRLEQRGQLTPENKTQLDALYAVLEAEPGQPLTTAQHETFADAFVEYMREGKAPTPELKSLFDTFSAWLLEIYRTVRGLVNDSDISEGLKPIFDRMLASDNAIREADQPGPVDLGGIVDDETASSLDQAYAEVVDTAHREGRKRALSDVWRSATKQYKARKKAIREEIKAELDQIKAYQVREYLLGKKIPDGMPPEYANQKLDRAAVKSILGVTALPPMLGNLTVEDGGLQPSVIANLFGYDTGSQMLTEFSDLKAYNTTLNERVKARLDEEFGDLDINDTEQLSNMARDSWASREKAEYYLQAVKALNKKLGGGPSGPTIRKAMKQLAQEHIRNTPFRDLAPGRYAQAERTLHVELAEAVAAGDQQQVRQKLLQLLHQQYLYDASKQARLDVEKARKYLLQSQTKKARGRMGKQMVGDRRPYRDAIDTLLSTVDLRKISYRDMDRAMRDPLAPGLYDQVNADIELIHSDDPTAAINIPDSISERRTVLNYRESKVGDILDLADTVRSIRHVGNRRNTIRVQGLRVDSDAQAELMGEAMEANAPRKRAPKPSITALKTRRQKAQKAQDEIRSYLVKPEALILEMDGGERGVMWNTLFDWATTAQHERNRMVDEYAPRWKALHEELVGDRRNEIIEFNGEQLTRGQVMGVALNMGSASNRKKLLEGYGWDYDTTLNQLQMHLSKADWRNIQKTWKMIDDLGPAAFDVHEQATGVRPEKVQATDITLADGTVIVGGYYPIYYNQDLRGENAQLNRVMELQADGGALVANNMGRKNVDGGAMESRTNMTAPLDLTMNVVPRHLTKQIMYITHWPGISDTYRILNHPKVRESMFANYGEAQHVSMMAWLENIALDGAALPAGKLVAPFEGALRHGRIMSTVGFFGIKVGTLAETLFGIGSTVHVAGSVNTAKGLRDYMTNGGDFALQNSKELSDSRVTFNREMRELSVQATDPNVTAMQRRRTQVSSALMMPMGLAQQLQNYIAWYAGYNQAIARGQPVPDAILHADITMRRSQGLNSPKDVAGTQRGGELHRTLMVAASWSVTFTGLLYQLTRQVVTPGRTGKVTAMTSFLIGVMYGQRLLMDYWRQQLPDEDEEESWLMYLFASTVGDLTQGIPLAREASSILHGFSPGGPLALSILDKDVQGSALLVALMSGEKSVDELTEAQLKQVLTLVSTLSYAMGVPLPINQAAEWGNLILTDTEIESLRDPIFGSPN